MAKIFLPYARKRRGTVGRDRGRKNEMPKEMRGGVEWRGDLLFFFLPHRRLKDALPVRYYNVVTGDGRFETGDWIL